MASWPILIRRASLRPLEDPTEVVSWVRGDARTTDFAGTQQLHVIGAHSSLYAGQMPLPLEDLRTANEVLAVAREVPASASLQSDSPSRTPFHSLFVAAHSGCGGVLALQNDGSLWFGRRLACGTGGFVQVAIPAAGRVVQHDVGCVTESNPGVPLAACVTSEGELWVIDGWDVSRGSVPVARPLSVGSEVRCVSCSGRHLAAVTTDGRLFTMGHGEHGQLGQGNKLHTSSALREAKPPRSEAKLGGRELRWETVACGSRHTAAVSTCGRLGTCGDGLRGQLGYTPVGAGGTCSWRMREVRRLDEEVVQVACGEMHTAVVTRSGRLYTCGGGNECAALGHGNTEKGSNGVTRLRVVDALLGHKVTKVSCGQHHTAAVTGEGMLWTFGVNRFGELGLTSQPSRHVPRVVPVLSNVADVSCGPASTIVIGSSCLSGVPSWELSEGSKEQQEAFLSHLDAAAHFVQAYGSGAFRSPLVQDLVVHAVEKPVQLIDHMLGRGKSWAAAPLAMLCLKLFHQRRDVADDILEALITCSGLNVPLVDNAGRTLLHYAVLTGSKSSDWAFAPDDTPLGLRSRLFHATDPDMQAPVDNLGFTPQHLALLRATLAINTATDVETQNSKQGVDKLYEIGNMFMDVTPRWLLLAVLLPVVGLGYVSWPMHVAVWMLLWLLLYATIVLPSLILVVLIGLVWHTFRNLWKRAKSRKRAGTTESTASTENAQLSTTTPTQFVTSSWNRVLTFCNVQFSRILLPYRSLLLRGYISEEDADEWILLRLFSLDIWLPPVLRPFSMASLWWLWLCPITIPPVMLYVACMLIATLIEGFFSNVRWLWRQAKGKNDSLKSKTELSISDDNWLQRGRSGGYIAKVRHHMFVNEGTDAYADRRPSVSVPKKFSIQQQKRKSLGPNFMDRAKPSVCLAMDEHTFEKMADKSRTNTYASTDSDYLGGSVMVANPLVDEDEVNCPSDYDTESGQETPQTRPKSRSLSMVIGAELFDTMRTQKDMALGRSLGRQQSDMTSKTSDQDDNLDDDVDEVECEKFLFPTEAEVEEEQHLSSLVVRSVCQSTVAGRYARNVFAIRSSISALLLWLLFLSLLFLVTITLTHNSTGGGYRFIAGIESITEDEEFGDDHLKYMDVATMEEFWQWMEEVMVEFLFRERFINGTSVPVDSGNLRVVGNIQIRQLRVKEETDCGQADHDHNISRHKDVCFGSYSRSAQYDDEMWRGTKYDDDLAMGMWGQVDTYPGAGFVTEISTENREKFVAKLTELKENNWLDEGTRAVFVEMNAANAYWGLVCAMQYLIEFSAAGVVMPSSIYSSFGTRHLGMRNYSWSPFAYGFFFLYTVMFIGRQGREMYQQGFGKFFFTNSWHILEVVLGLMLGMSWLASLTFYTYDSRVKEMLETPDKYTSVQLVAYTAYFEMFCFAAIQVLAGMRLLRFMEGLPDVGPVVSTLIGTLLAKPTLVFLLVMAVFIISVATGLTTVLGLVNWNFSTMYLATIYTFKGGLLGDLELESLYRKNRLAGPVIYVAVIVVLTVALSNLLIGILSDEYHKRTQLSVQQWNRRLTREMATLWDLEAHRSHRFVLGQHFKPADENQLPSASSRTRAASRAAEAGISTPGASAVLAERLKATESRMAKLERENAELTSRLALAESAAAATAVDLGDSDQSQPPTI